MKRKPTPIFLDSFTDVADVKHMRARFSFSRMFGPLFMDYRTGEDLKIQPEPGHWRWSAFENWHRQYLTDCRAKLAAKE